jgi:hypothetical protein
MSAGTTQTTTKSTPESIQDYAARPVQVVREHPVPASLILFGMGVGIGLLLTSKACEAMMHEETTSERLSRQFHDALNELKSTAQRAYSSMR